MSSQFNRATIFREILFDYKELIDGKPMHIASISPNLSVASDVRVMAEDKILISVNE